MKRTAYQKTELKKLKEMLEDFKNDSKLTIDECEAVCSYFVKSFQLKEMST